MSFGNVAELHAQRSSWKMPLPMSTSFKHGELIPLATGCFEVIPGDTFKCDLSSLVRLNTPIAPIMGSDIEVEINAFFVPMRLVWSHTEEFFGANKLQAGAQTTVYTIPRKSVYTGINWNSLGAYFGKPIIAQDSTKVSAGYGMASVLKERAYYKIWSDFYRASMIQNPCIVDLGDTQSIGTLNGTYLSFAQTPLQVNKNLDYFVAALESPQYGGAGVQLPLGATAPVGFVEESGLAISTGSTLSVGLVAGGEGSLINTSDSGKNIELFADLSQASAATINQLRYALATQTYLETLNYGGSQYWSILNAVYGVTPADASLQRPQRIGTIKFTLNMSQVTAMADTTINGAVKPAGSVGAVSVTGHKGHLFTKAFDEPGYVITLLHTRLSKQVYSNQGILKEDSKSTRLEFYAPQFANLGDQPIKNKEIYLSGSGTDEQVFGYQECWAEYRFAQNVGVTGILNPNASGAVDYWTYAKKFTSLPQLNSSFLQEDRNDVAGRLITGSSSTHDYIADFNFDMTAIRPMPVRANPARLDHYIK